jgi:hypothetical protein
VPVSLLSAASFYSLLQLEQNIANMYFGTVTIITNLSEGHRELLEMRLDIGRLLSTDDEQKRQELLASISQSESGFLGTLIGYKEIDDFPLQIGILERRGLGNLTSYEDSLLTQVNSDWLDFQRERNTVITLSNAGLREDATVYSNTVAADKFSKLILTYNQIVELNNDLARIMYEESQLVVETAFMYEIIFSVSSTAFAGAMALAISRRLAPSVEEIQKDARKKIERFVSESKMLRAIGKREAGPEASDSTKNLTLRDVQQVHELVEKGPMVLLHSSRYKELKNNKPSEDQQKTVADLLLDYYLTSPSSVAGKKGNLVLITKRSSNLYPVGHDSGATVYIMSSSSQEPVSTSEDGLLVISVNQTPLIFEAVKRTLSGNPESVIILDNITELIHRLGFERVFSLVQSISDAASLYPNSRIILLINEHAHPQNEVEAVATICNIFAR